jgi:hypothetical protein
MRAAVLDAAGQPFRIARTRQARAAARPGAGAHPRERREPARHQDPRRPGGPCAAAAAFRARARPGRRGRVGGPGRDEVQARRRGVRHGRRHRRAAGHAGRVRGGRRRPARAEAAQPGHARGRRAAAGVHHGLGRAWSTAPRRRPARRCWCTAGRAAWGTWRCNSPFAGRRGVRDRQPGAGRHHPPPGRDAHRLHGDLGRGIRRAAHGGRGLRRGVRHGRRRGARRLVRGRAPLRRPCGQLPGLGHPQAGAAVFPRGDLLGRVHAAADDHGPRPRAPRRDPGGGGAAGGGRAARAADGRAPVHAGRSDFGARGDRDGHGARARRGRRRGDVAGARGRGFRRRCAGRRPASRPAPAACRRRRGRSSAWPTP